MSKVHDKDSVEEFDLDNEEIELSEEELSSLEEEDTEIVDGDVIDVTDDEEVTVKGEVVESKSSKNELALDGELNLDFSSLGVMPGVVVGDLGLTISRFPVERAKFTKGQKALINIVTDKVIAVKVHYREGLGSYLCFGGKCCEMDGLARVKYIFPINMYDTNKKGQPISTELQHLALSIGSDQYEDIKDIGELNDGLTDCDILVSCKDEQYQKLSFQNATPKEGARCRNNKKWKKQMAESNEFWQENFKHIIKSTARQITEKEYMKDLEETTQDITDDVDFDKVFD